MQTNLPHRGIETSILAGRKAGRNSAENKEKIIYALANDFAHGSTSYEMSDFLKKDHACIQPRFSDLRDEGKIIRTDKTRLNHKGNKASVWVLA